MLLYRCTFVRSIAIKSNRVLMNKTDKNDFFTGTDEFEIISRSATRRSHGKFVGINYCKSH